MLLYQLDTAPIEQHLIRMAKETGQIPRQLAEKADLLPGVGIFLDAWFQLSTCRPPTSDGTEAPIPWTAIEEYAKAYNFDPETKSDLHYHVRALDVVYVEWVRKKRKTKQGASDNGGRVSKGRKRLGK